MSTANEKIVEVLNDLILINSDRSTAYEKAMKQAAGDDADVIRLFKNMAANSRKYLYELAGHIDPSGQELFKNIPFTNGKSYAVWANARTNFKINDRQALLASSGICEVAIEKAYDEALKEEIPEEIKQVIAQQKNELKKNREKIKRLHAMQQTV